MYACVLTCAHTFRWLTSLGPWNLAGRQLPVCQRNSSALVLHAKLTCAHTPQMADVTRAMELGREAAAYVSEIHSPLILSCSRVQTLQVADVTRAMELGREAAAYVSEKFIRPVKLEFEKVGNPQKC